jgi:hypothetical protein
MCENDLEFVISVINCIMKSFMILYSLLSIIRIMKARRMRWVGHVARMVRRGTHIGCWWESQREGH